MDREYWVGGMVSEKEKTGIWLKGARGVRARRRLADSLVALPEWRVTSGARFL